MAKGTVQVENLPNVLKAALAKTNNATKDTVLTVGDHSFDAILHIKGTLRQGENFQKTPTAAIPWMEVAFLLAKRAGFQREAVVQIVAETAKEAFENKEKVQISPELTADEAGEKAKELFKSMLGTLKKIDAKGQLTLVDNMTVEVVNPQPVVVETSPAMQAVELEKVSQ